ncbi:MAG: hypothetical protein AAFX76_01075 [Planctomycetota bacterium]
MKNPTPLPLIGLCFAVLLTAEPASPQPTESAPAVDLRPLWTAGQASRYEFWNRFEQTIEQRLGDRSTTVTNVIEVEGEVTWTVDRVNPDGSSRCTMTLDWMTFASTPSEGEGTTADSRRSATADNKPMHELLTAMAGVPLKIDIAPDGHVVRVAGITQMKAKTSAPDFVPSELDFEETASDLASLAHAPPPRGDAGVETGRTWKADFTWDHELGTMDHDWRYTLDAVEDLSGLPVAVVTGTAKLKLNPDLSDAPPDAPPLNIRLLDGEATTRVLFDLTRHEAVGRHSTATERVRVTVSLPNGSKFERTMTDNSVGQVLRIEEN